MKHYVSDSNPLSDRLLSTDTLDIEHFSASYRRAEKMEFIHTWEPVQKYLRVCGVALRDDGAPNYGRCEKCLRTMIPIYALGSMDQFKSFTRPLKSDRDLCFGLESSTLFWVSYLRLLRLRKNTGHKCFPG